MVALFSLLDDPTLVACLLLLGTLMRPPPRRPYVRSISRTSAIDPTSPLFSSFFTSSSNVRVGFFKEDCCSCNTRSTGARSQVEQVEDELVWRDCLNSIDLELVRREILEVVRDNSLSTVINRSAPSLGATSSTSTRAYADRRRGDP
jgi:hypothetical protein